MNFHALFLALVLGATTLYGQETSVPPVDTPVLLAQAASPKPAAAPAASKPAPAAPAASDTTTIPARSAAAAPAKSGDSSQGILTLWKLVQDGGLTMIILGFLSVVTVMLILVYLFTLRRGAILTPHYMNTAEVLLKKRDYLGLLAISSRHSEAVARVVQRTLDFKTKNPSAPIDVIRDIAETEGASQAASLQHRTVYLADIGMLAPMVGLLGTVVGIITAFGKLGADSNASRDILLASGVSQALVATATGLILGIGSMFFYAVFRNRVQSLISDLEIASAHIMGLIALDYNKKRDSQARVAVDEEF